MIKLFVSDIDGCLAVPYRPYDLQGFQALARHAALGAQVPRQPSVALCSGRPYPYVEAVTQALGLRMPVLFESGGGLFDPVAGRVAWAPAFSAEVAEEVEAVRRWLGEACVPGTAMMVDLGKRTQAGVIGPDAAEVQRSVPRVEEHVAANHPGFRVFHTDISIDVVPAGITKKEGLAWLAAWTGVPMEAMAYIGDTNGDLEALGAVAFSFAPANATPAVRAVARVVTRGRVLEGVLEAYRWCQAWNTQHAARRA